MKNTETQRSSPSNYATAALFLQVSQSTGSSPWI